MRCKECKYLKTLSNTEECNQGICSIGNSWEPTDLDNECSILPKSYTCGDCDRFGCDFACATCQSDDSAYILDGNLCPGFIDKKEAELKNILFEWRLRGFDIKEKIIPIIEEVIKFPVPERSNNED